MSDVKSISPSLFQNFNKINTTTNNQPNEETINKDKEKSIATKLMIGATALASSIALGIYIAKKGKLKSNSIDAVQNNKPLSQTVENTQTAQPSTNIVQDTPASTKSSIDKIAENGTNSSEVPAEKGITELQTQSKSDMTPEKPLNSELDVLSKPTSETTPTAMEISKLQLTADDICIKNNLQELIGAEIPDEIYLKIKNASTSHIERGKFSFSSLELYKKFPGFANNKNCLFYVIKEIKPENPLEDEALKVISFAIDKNHCGQTDISSRFKLLTDLLKLYEQNPDINFKHKEQILKEYNELTDSWLARIKDKDLSPEEKNKIMKELLSFKKGIGFYLEPKKITNADYINAILSASRPIYRKKDDIAISQQHLDEIALDLARKISPSYEEATKLAIENNNPTIDLLKRRGDRYLPNKQNELYDEDTQNFIFKKYIDCEEGGAYAINNILRNEEFNETDKHTKDIIKKFDRLIKESNKLDNDYVVFRALDFPVDSDKWLPWKKVGNIITDKGFVSTTPTNGTYLRMFGGRPGENYILRIKLPKGTQGINMRRLNNLPNEKNEEYLLPRDSSFRILSVDESTKVIDLEYLLPE